MFNTQPLRSSTLWRSLMRPFFHLQSLNFDTPCRLSSEHAARTDTRRLKFDTLALGHGRTRFDTLSELNQTHAHLLVPTVERSKESQAPGPRDGNYSRDASYLREHKVTSRFRKDDLVTSVTKRKDVLKKRCNPREWERSEQPHLPPSVCLRLRCYTPHPNPNEQRTTTRKRRRSSIKKERKESKSKSIISQLTNRWASTFESDGMGDFFNLPTLARPPAVHRCKARVVSYSSSAGEPHGGTDDELASFNLVVKRASLEAWTSKIQNLVNHFQVQKQARPRSTRGSLAAGRSSMSDSTGVRPIAQRAARRAHLSPRNTAARRGPTWNGPCSRRYGCGDCDERRVLLVPHFARISGIVCPAPAPGGVVRRPLAAIAAAGTRRIRARVRADVVHDVAGMADEQRMSRLEDGDVRPVFAVGGVSEWSGSRDGVVILFGVGLVRLRLMMAGRRCKHAIAGLRGAATDIAHARIAIAGAQASGPATAGPYTANLVRCITALGNDADILTGQTEAEREGLEANGAPLPLIVLLVRGEEEGQRA
ncbi:hypothetical protein DFH06DRAFT_1151751 [Mycena polygramma]|nr:hypothetical protein DFH06DRAFT_1151751 [Mycena polygramma]